MYDAFYRLSQSRFCIRMVKHPVTYTLSQYEYTLASSCINLYIVWAFVRLYVWHENFFFKFVSYIISISPK